MSREGTTTEQVRLAVVSAWYECIRAGRIDDAVALLDHRAEMIDLLNGDVRIGRDEVQAHLDQRTAAGFEVVSDDVVLESRGVAILAHGVAEVRVPTADGTARVTTTFRDVHRVAGSGRIMSVVSYAVPRDSPAADVLDEPDDLGPRRPQDLDPG